jgi:hypothetical protein
LIHWKEVAFLLQSDAVFAAPLGIVGGEQTSYFPSSAVHYRFVQVSKSSDLAELLKVYTTPKRGLKGMKGMLKKGGTFHIPHATEVR